MIKVACKNQVMKMLFMACVCLSAALACEAHAEIATKVDNANSEVRFSGEHVGMKFSGKFGKWNASLVLPPLNDPSITATFQMKTAKTGDFTYDSTLLEGDWFDVVQYPLGKFESTTITQVDNDYEVIGELTLKGVSQKVQFVLRKKAKKLSATFEIDRIKYNIGVESDPDSEWVSRTIQMSLVLHVQ